jgi:superfamily II DNA or RNA helicase
MESKILMTGERAEQAHAVEAMVAYLKGGELGAILKSDPGTGKTVMGMEIVRRLGRTALIVVHKEFLIDQWRKRIAKFLPTAKVGLVQGKKCDFRGKDIVLAMVHSLALDSGEKYPAELYDYFGTIVVDELHRISAYTWSQVPARFRARWRVGLTATPRRKDGTEAVFFWQIGYIAHETLIKMPVPKVRRVEYQTELPRWMVGRKVNDGQLLSVVAADKGRSRRIVDEITAAVSASSKRKVLVISERLEHLRQMKDDFERACRETGRKVTTAVYVGQWFTGEMVPKKKGLTPAQEAQAKDRVLRGLPELKRQVEIVEKKRTVPRAELDAAESAQVMFATKSMVEEGFDVPAIDTLVLSMPMGDVEQVLGRAQRLCVPEPDKDQGKCERMCPWRAGECKGKPQPVVVDVVDVTIDAFRKKAEGRKRFYKQIGVT